MSEPLDLHRDLVSRLGFGDNITEPMADNDTIVAWFEELGRDANEWQESQLWRNDCYAKGHPDDDDCFECDPRLRLERAESDLAVARATISTLGDAYREAIGVPETEHVTRRLEAMALAVERAQADLTDEKRRRAELRAGVERLLRIAEYRDANSLSTDFEGRPYRHPIAQDDLRALLDTATEETQGAP